MGLIIIILAMIFATNWHMKLGLLLGFIIGLMVSYPREEEGQDIEC